MIFLQQNCVENSILKHPLQMANMFLQLKVDFDHWCSKRERGDDSQSLEFFHQRGENPLDHHNYFKCQQIDISDWWHKKLTISQSLVVKGKKSHKMYHL